MPTQIGQDETLVVQLADHQDAGLVASVGDGRIDCNRDLHPANEWLDQLQVGPVLVDQVQGPQRTLDVLQVFSVQLLPAEACALVLTNYLLLEDRRQVDQILVGRPARHHRTRGSPHFADLLARSRGRGYHDSWGASKTHAQPVIGYHLVEVAECSELVDPPGVVLRAAQ